MPNRSLTRIAKNLSTYYYAYGNLIASKTYLVLIFSLSFISYFSLPYITKSLRTPTTPTTHNNIPLSQISTSLDAQCWHASAHVQFNNFTTSRPNTLPPHYLITERLRLSIPHQPVTFELIQQAKAIYTSITTTFVLNEKNKPVSLENICYQHEGHCLVHAPPFSTLNDEKEWRKRTNIHNQPTHQYEQHPYSIYSNTTFDFPSGELIKADAVLLTFVLKQTQNGNTLRIWNNILQQVKKKHQVVDYSSSIAADGAYDNHHQGTIIWYASSNTTPQMIQYKFNLFPYELSYKVQITMVVYLLMFYLVSLSFGKSNLVKSGYTFGLAAVFLSIACFTTTWGIVIKLDMPLNSVPWYLLLLAVNIGSLENIFLLTNAVLYAGCDMNVKEKVSRGLQSVGVPMTVTLMAELFILTLGDQMDTALIKEFCMFTKIALCVDYILEMTFVIAVLSIDIKRVDLADLDDRQMSKRLHELAAVNNSNNKQDGNDVNQQQGPDFCPVQDTPNKEDSKSCAECKDFKTHRVLNALMICFVVLFLAMFCSKENNHHMQNHLYRSNTPSDLNQLSDQFWSTVNPEKDVTWLQIQPPHLFIYDNDAERVSQHVEQLQQLYLAKSMVVRTKIEHRPSLFRQFILSSVQNALVFLLHINVPLLMLCLVTVGIITWMTPKWRDQWLLPFLTRAFNQFILTLIRWFPTQFIKRVYNFYFKGQPWHSTDTTKEYDANEYHRGAISVQNTFNQQQYRANVKQVQVKTLTNQHTADIQNLDANAKSSLVSCGQDGRLVLWHAHKATWMARLDKLSSRGGALLNPTFYNSHHHHHTNNKKKKVVVNKRQQQQKRKSSSSSSSSSTATALSAKSHLSKARCIKVDEGNRWIAAGYDDGVIRIWNVISGALVRELELQPHSPSVIEVQQEDSSSNVGPTSAPKLRNRFSHASVAATTKHVDHILFIHFMGTSPEYCHPLVAEAAARSKAQVTTQGAQNIIVSAHKSGVLHEWDIMSGECIQTIKTGHTRDITQLHIVNSTLHRGWIFTASKDGTVKCWERRHQLQQQETRLLYTIEQSSPVTSIATEIPVGGLGVLVTGYQDGSVRVWNFETGESVCTLSMGKSPSTTTSRVSTKAVHQEEGGPIRKFSKFTSSSGSSSSISHTSAFSSASCSSFSDSSDDGSSDEKGGDSDKDGPSFGGGAKRIRHRHHQHHHHSTTTATAANHRGAIYQVVVTRYCEVENGPGLCRGCDTCFGNGFLVASSSIDNKVHAWRLERADNGPEGSCTLCTKDYHRKQYKHRKASVSSVDINEELLKPTTTSTRRTRRTRPPSIQLATKRQPSSWNSDLSTMELLDIEQLAGDASHILLKSTFLGKVDQPAGRGVVFCDKILAGVRRVRHHHHHHHHQDNKQEGEWEAWFASLQYYEPSKEENGTRIPIETFSLDHDTPLVENKKKKAKNQDGTVLQHLVKNILSHVFSNSVLQQRDEGQRGKRSTNGYYSSCSSSDSSSSEDEQDDLDNIEHDLEASENLPFSAVRHIIPLDGSGLACDFGNFIKLVYLDSKMSLTEKERLKQTREAIDAATTKKAFVELVEEEEGEEEGEGEEEACQCDSTTNGVDGCCGGVNKKENGACCGGAKNVHKLQQGKRRQKAAAVAAAAALATTTTTATVFVKKSSANDTCGGMYSIADCSLRNNCSRASDCSSVVNSAAAHLNTSNNNFSYWL